MFPPQFSPPAGKSLLKAKGKLLALGYANCDRLIEQHTANELECIPGCNAEETLEAKLIKGDNIPINLFVIF